MFDYIYEWIQNVAFYLVLVTAALHAVPNQDYRKYIRFFTGLVLILMIMTPILRLFGTEVRIQDFIDQGTEMYTEYQEGARTEKYEEQTEKEGEGIGVERIQIEW